MADPSQLAWLEHFKIERDAAASSSRRRQVDNWVRGKTIGTGAFGQVYVERSSKTNKFRAVKEIRKQSQRQDLNSELLALTRLSRPAYEEYFVQFLGWYDDQWILSLVMEYFELGDLRKYMLTATPEPEPRVFPELEAREIVLQLFFGLQAMHKDGFAHRDLKPENIFVVSKDPWHIKIGDFGISKRVLDNETFLRTMEVGTRSYMAPEVLELLPRELESSTYHNTVDIWAGGIILYELLCAAKPFFRSRSLSEYCFGQRKLPTVSLLSQGVSEAGVALIERLLQVVPSDRPDADTVLEAEWFDLEIHESSQDKATSPASTSATKPLAPSAFPVSHLPPFSLPERSLTAAQASQIGNVHSEADRNKLRTSSRRRAVVDQVVQLDESGGEFGQAHKTPPLAKTPPAATVAPSTLRPSTLRPSTQGQSVDLDFSKTIRGAVLSQKSTPGQPVDPSISKTIREAIFSRTSAKEVEAVETEDTLVPLTEDELIPPGLSVAPHSKFDLDEDEARFSPWRKHPLEFPQTTDETKYQTMRRQGAAACVSDSNVAFVIGGMLSRRQETEDARDTWKLTISNENILCTPVEARDLPQWSGGWAGMIDNNLVYICREYLSQGKLFSLDQVQGAWRERRGSLESGTNHKYCTFGRNLVMYKEVIEKSWRNIAQEGSRYRWYFEIDTMDLSMITSKSLPPWKPLIRQTLGSRIGHRYCAMIEYRQSVIIFREDSIRQFDPITKTLDQLPMPSLDPRDRFYAVAIIGDNFYVYGTNSLFGELFALHLPTLRWRQLEPYRHLVGARMRKEFTLLAMGTRLVLFGGENVDTKDDYVTLPNGRRTECVWVLDTAEDLKWEDIDIKPKLLDI